MTRTRTLLWSATAAAFLALLAGWFALQPEADQVLGEHPGNKANHHPRSGDGATN